MTLSQQNKGEPTTAGTEFSALLNALEGLAYVAGADGTILAVGEPAWTDFATANDAPSLHGRVIVGRNLFAGTSDPQVLALQKRLHQLVLEGGRPSITYEYRCDAPDQVRRMRMALTPVQIRTTMAVLYHSVVLEEYPRPHMSLFEANRTNGEAETPTVTMCSYCHDVAWPIGAPAETRSWIEPEAYYRQGGPSQIMVSHGICPACYDRLTAKLA